ncbi:hypothetical protein DN069_12115 [Streptacidiphilus pinicola]|uniref:DUF5304 domain-containing protein n=1 Tax=Streptacidiphilus pinicola TaxID=2219663 RepID=A0A2X0J572_9ACTN|nr:DUF5304 family protein [Streptacidiphilus pinicola]RAG85396.1 hypothetical protein DN069_12115 [Streptacidiphilus pinicola]
MSMAEDNAADRSGDVWAEAVAEQEHGMAEPGPVAEHEEVAETGSGEGDGAGAQSPFGADLPFGTELGPLVDEVRRFASTVSEKVTSLSSGQSDPMEVLQNLAAPLRSSSPAVYGHLLAAGGELIAAYRAAVSASERRWAAPKQNGTEHIDLD